MRFVLGAPLLFALSCFLPLVSYAQTDIRATIEQSLREDPSAATLTPEEFSRMIDALAAEAQAQGLGAGDLMYTPPPPEFTPVEQQTNFGGLSALHITLFTGAGFIVLFLCVWFLYRFLHRPPEPPVTPETQTT